MSPRHIREMLRANGLESGLEFGARFALHAFLKFMLPPGLSPELALTWARHALAMVLTLPQLHAVRAEAPALA